MNNLPPLFPDLIAKDQRVYLVKQAVNTLLASSLANEENGLFKLNSEQEQRMRDSISNSNRFDAAEKVAFKELIELCLENKYIIRSVSATWRADVKLIDAIETFKIMVTTDPIRKQGEPLNFGDLSWVD